MIRKEPYIGMPIVLGEYDDAPAEQRCSVDIVPKPEEPQPPQNPQPPQEQPQQKMMVAMAYVPWQQWQQPYDYEKGLSTGTIFPDLNLPFMGYQGGMKR